MLMTRADTPVRSTKQLPLKKGGPTTHERAYHRFFEMSSQPEASEKDDIKRCTTAVEGTLTAIHVLDDQALILVYEESGYLGALVSAEGGTKLPTRSLRGIWMYCQNFRIPNNATDRVYYRLKIATDIVPHEFLFGLKTVLRNQGANAFDCPLQDAHPKTIGWLSALTPNIDKEAFTMFLNYYVPEPLKKKGVRFGLKAKPIWSGTKKSDQKKNDKETRYFALHVDCPKQAEVTARMWLRTFLARSEIRGYLNYAATHLRLMPMMTMTTPPFMKSQMTRIRAKHGRTLKNTFSATVRGLLDLDRPIGCMTGEVTMRMLVLRWPVEGTTTDERLFLLIEPSPDESDAHRVHFKQKHHGQGALVADCFGKYVHHHYGDDILCEFSPDEVDRIQAMQWDHARNRPITQQEAELTEWADLELDFGDLEETKERTATVTQLERPNPDVEPQDDASIGSVSTFKTMSNLLQQRPTYGTMDTPVERQLGSAVAVVDDLSSVSSFDTRVSTLETTIQQQKRLLTKNDQMLTQLLSLMQQQHQPNAVPGGAPCAPTSTESTLTTTDTSSPSQSEQSPEVTSAQLAPKASWAASN